MSYLQIGGLVLGHLACLGVGIALGCAVNVDRKDIGTLSLGVASIGAAGALVFWFL